MAASACRGEESKAKAPPGGTGVSDGLSWRCEVGDLNRKSPHEEKVQMGREFSQCTRTESPQIRLSLRGLMGHRGDDL